MKLKRVVAACLATMMVVSSFTACGSTSKGSSDSGSKSTTDSEKTLSYADIKLGESYKDVKTTIKLLTHRTDMCDDSYSGTSWKEYIAEFNKLYPNITVKVEGVTNYADDSLLRLQGGKWGDVMMIPAVDKADLSKYFLSYGDVKTMADQINYVNTWKYDDKIYGVPSTANALGIVYNKAIFEKAGITKIPTTPDEFIADLKLIKDKTDAIPLYTNYAAGWTLGAWDAYIGGNATGDAKYMNQVLLHSANPFADPKDGTHAYNVYKILYDAVAGKLIEDDYTTTDWEGSKGMMNSGKVATMVLGSWAVSQMKAAGDKPDDVSYMPFPITVDGKQYSSAGADYSYGINADATSDNQKASMVFVKWMTEKSGFSFNEGGLPIAKADTKLPDVYKAFEKVTLLIDEPAVSGEEDLLNSLNADSELAVNAGGNDKIMKIVEHAADGDMKFDDIMKEWNQKWTDAQDSNSVETK